MAYGTSAGAAGIPFPNAGNTVESAEESKRANAESWHLLADNQYIHNNGVVMNDAGGFTQLRLGTVVEAGRWLVKGLYVETTGTSLVTGITNGQTNYIFAQSAATAAWDASVTFIAKTTTTANANQFMLGTYNMSGSTVNAVRNLAPHVGVTSGRMYTQGTTRTIVNTTTETSLLDQAAVSPTLGTTRLMANFFYPGRTIGIRARGYYSTTGDPGTLNIRVNIGTINVLATGVLTAAGTVTNLIWEAEAEITCRTAGAAGTLWGMGRYLRQNDMATDYTPLFIWGMVNTTTTAIDTTQVYPIDLTATWGTANAGNSISCPIASVDTDVKSNYIY